jgi:hypothetical protein
VHDYRGLWGLDTHDVFGGERAPAGPRYERGGAARASWADPLGWAGLRKEAPGDAAAAADLRAQVQALAARVRELDEEVAAGHAALRGAAAEQRSLAAGPIGLRASAAAKRVAVRKAGRTLADLCAEHTRLSEELAVHREHLARPVDRGAVDERLRPASTSPPEPGRPRLLRLWGAVSTPLLLLTVVLVLVGPPLAFLSSLTLAAVTFLGVEAAARGRLLSFVVGLGMAVLIAVVGVVLVVALLQNWRVVLAALLSVVALVLLAGNVRELRR